MSAGGDEYGLDTGVALAGFSHQHATSPCDVAPDPCLYFGPDSQSNHSHQFDVGPDTPMMILGFDLPTGDSVSVEMVAGAAGGEYFAEVMRDGQPRYSLTRETNAIVIGAAGRYRLRYNGVLGEAFVVCQPQSCCSAGLYVGG
jgi:hypothetical protein